MRAHRRRRRQQGAGEEGQMEDVSVIRQERKTWHRKPHHDAENTMETSTSVNGVSVMVSQTKTGIQTPSAHTVYSAATWTRFNTEAAEYNLLYLSASFTCTLKRCSFADVIQVRLQSPFHRTQPPLWPFTQIFIIKRWYKLYVDLS